MNNAKYDTYILTFKDSDIWGPDHKEIKSVLSRIDSITYWCMCDEIVKSTENYHTHLFIMFSDPVPVSHVIRIFPAAHIVPNTCDFTESISYVEKRGRYADLNNNEIHLSDTYEDIYNPLKEEPEGESGTLLEEEPETNEGVIPGNGGDILCLIAVIVLVIVLVAIIL